MRKKWSGQIAIQHIYLGLTTKNSVRFFFYQGKETVKTLHLDTNI